MASLQRDFNVDTISSSKSLVIPHKSISSSASLPGTVAYDPTGKAIIYCDGTAWFLIGGTSVPITTTDNALARFNGAAGTVQDSLATLSDAGELTTPSIRTNTIAESTATNGVQFAAGSRLIVNDASASISTSTGSITTLGGVGIAGALNVGGTVSAAAPTLDTHLATKLYVDTVTTVVSGDPGSGDVAGPTGATDNAIARFDEVTGKLIQNSGVTINDSNEINKPVGPLKVQGLVISNQTADCPMGYGSQYAISLPTSATGYNIIHSADYLDVYASNMSINALAGGICDVGGGPGVGATPGGRGSINGGDCAAGTTGTAGSATVQGGDNNGSGNGGDAFLLPGYAVAAAARPGNAIVRGGFKQVGSGAAGDVLIYGGIAMTEADCGKVKLQSVYLPGNVLKSNIECTNTETTITGGEFDTDATSSTTAGVIVSSGLAVAKSVQVGGNITLSGYTIEGTDASGLEIRGLGYMEIKPVHATTGSTPGGTLTLEGGFAGSGTTGVGGNVSVVGGGTGNGQPAGHAYIFGGPGAGGTSGGNVYLGHPNYVDGNVQVRTTIDATSSTAGAFVCDGGAAIAKKLYVGETIVATGTVSGATPTLGTHLATKAYVDSAGVSPYVAKTTWSPNPTAAVNISAMTGVTGYYSRIGDVVFFSIVIDDVTLTSATAITTAFYFTLPVTNGLQTAYVRPIGLVTYDSANGANHKVTFRFTAETTQGLVYFTGSTANNRPCLVTGSYIV